MWEYAIREYAHEWGEQTADRSMSGFRGGGPGGWDSFTFVVLLKRLRPATDMG
jgi:hypothetical protein